jgi:hypothetical protein
MLLLLLLEVLPVLLLLLLLLLLRCPWQEAVQVRKGWCRAGQWTRPHLRWTNTSSPTSKPRVLSAVHM